MENPEQTIDQLNRLLPYANVWLDNTDHSVHISYDDQGNIKEFFRTAHISSAYDIHNHADVVVSNDNELHFMFQLHEDAKDFAHNLRDPHTVGVDDFVKLAREQRERDVYLPWDQLYRLI